MLRYYIKTGGALCASPFTPFKEIFSTDQVDSNTATAKSVDTSIIHEESGWSRVKRLFETNEFGELSQELTSVLQVGCMSTFLGGIYGGVINSRTSYMDFMKNNQATAFESHLDAKRKLQDKVTLSFGKGAFRWGWRLALFSCSFVGFSTLISTYRGKTGILEYVAAGAITGSLYKFNMGPRGWVVGGALGSVLGLMCGGATLGLLRMAGISMEEARYWQQNFKHKRLEAFRQAHKEYVASENYAVIEIHDAEIGESGKNIQNIPDEVKVT